MQQMLVLPSEMSSQDTQALAPSIQWPPSQLGKVHYAAEESSIVTSEPTGLLFLPGLCAHTLLNHTVSLKLLDSCDAVPFIERNQAFEFLFSKLNFKDI